MSLWWRPAAGSKIKDRRWRSFILFYFVNTTGFVILPRIPQGRERVRGEPLPGSPLAFNHPPAGDHFCTAKVPHQQKRDIQKDVSFLLVRAMGLEPTRPYGHKHLKLACLPIPARSQTEYPSIIAKRDCLSRGTGKIVKTMLTEPYTAARCRCSLRCSMGIYASWVVTAR